MGMDEPAIIWVPGALTKISICLNTDSPFIGYNFIHPLNEFDVLILGELMEYYGNLLGYNEI